MEFEFSQGLVDDAVVGLQEFIDTENLFIQKEHELEHSFGNIEMILIHIDERFRQQQPSMHDFTGHLTDLLAALRKELEQGRHRGLAFVQEEKRLLTQLRFDKKHRGLRAVKVDIADIKREEENRARVEENDLRHLKEIFLELVAHIKSAPEITNPETKKYLDHILWFAQTYGRAFQELLEKEQEIISKGYR